MLYIAHICDMSSVILKINKEIKRRKPSITPKILFPRQLFDSIWSTDERIPVVIVFEVLTGSPLKEKVMHNG